MPKPTQLTLPSIATQPTAHGALGAEEGKCVQEGKCADDTTLVITTPGGPMVEDPSLPRSDSLITVASEDASDIDNAPLTATPNAQSAPIITPGSTAS